MSYDAVTFDNAKNKALFVDNDKLVEVLCAWRAKRQEAKDAGKELPRLPEYVGIAAMNLAQNLSRHPSFSGYSYRDDMISDALLTVCRYIHNFDPTVETKTGTPSAFSYIRRIIWQAFSNTIVEEHKEQYLKSRGALAYHGLEKYDDDMSSQDASAMSEIVEASINKVFEYEGKMQTKQDIKDAKKSEAKAEKQRAVIAGGVSRFMKGATA